MKVDELKIIFPDRTDKIKKGTVYMVGIVESIAVRPETGIIEIKFKEGSEYEYRIIPFQSIESIDYKGVQLEGNEIEHSTVGII